MLLNKLLSGNRKTNSIFMETQLCIVDNVLTEILTNEIQTKCTTILSDSKTFDNFPIFILKVYKILFSKGNISTSLHRYKQPDDKFPPA